MRILLTLLAFAGVVGGLTAGPGGATAVPVALGAETTGAAWLEAPRVGGCPEPDSALEKRGREVYASAGNCAACHGPAGRGTPLAPDLTDDEWLNLEGGSYEEIVGLVAGGVPAPVRFPAPMPAEGGGDLSDDQVCAVAAYVLSLRRSSSR
jgi:mono/diheme cytochrome c family protein